MSDILTVREASQRLGLRPVTVYSLVQRGVMTPLRPGLPILLTRGEVERYLRERRRPGRPTGSSRKK